MVRNGRHAPLVTSGLVIAAALVVANLLNALFQFALARVLKPADYALLAALYAAILIGAVPTYALQASVAREMVGCLAAGDRARAGVVFRDTFRSTLRWASALIVLAVVALGPVSLVADVQAALAVSATICAIALGLVAPVVWGGLQATGAFGALGAAQVLMAGARLGAAAAIALSGGSVSAIIAGIAVVTAASAVLSAAPLRDLLREARPTRPERRPLATSTNGGAALAFTALTALPMVDLIVAKLALPAFQAGAYAAGSVYARTLLIVPLSVMVVVFPRIASLRSERHERRHLLASLGVVAVVALPATAVLWGLADPLLRLGFGAKYAIAAPWLGPLALAMTLFALSQVYLYHFLALGKTRFSLVLTLLLVLQAGAFAALHDRPVDLVGVQLAAGLATVIAAELYYRAEALASRPGARVDAPERPSRAANT